ncbi:MAG TPA: nuclear transport factor 2 family protein [Solirubrobacterales bacterium]|nr:nuclear transport factor 2 family protein [Solirubrobacterales bacterium]
MPTLNEELIERFYSAFGQRDGAAMAACYTPDATFTDPVFQDLKGDEPGAMWRMLTERADDLRIDLIEREAGDERGSAHWVAHYTYSQTGRPVENDIRASFRFQDGRIAEHVDSFDLYKWLRQALGPTGTLLGWTPILRGAVRRRARAALDEFRQRESSA